MAVVDIPGAELDKLLRNAGGAVLVGARALAYWVAYYRVRIDGAAGTLSTHDVDFLGDRDDARRLALAVGGTVSFPENMSILAGVVSKTIRAGHQYEVDVLRTLNGLSPAAVRKRASKATENLTGTSYFVMSPVDCLVSRLENLRTIAAKRTADGIWQARMGVKVVRACIESLLVDAREKEAIRVATDVLRAATHAMGMNAFNRHGIEVLESVPIDAYRSRNFVEQQWVRSVSRIQQLRTSTVREA